MQRFGNGCLSFFILPALGVGFGQICEKMGEPSFNPQTLIHREALPHVDNAFADPFLLCAGPALCALCSGGKESKPLLFCYLEGCRCMALCVRDRTAEL